MPDLLLVLVLAGATLIRSAFGFGEALIAVPLLALMIPVDVAAPIAVLVSITVAAIVIAQDWRAIHLRSAAHLVLATVVGTPVGLLLLTAAPQRVVKMLLAVCIIGFSAYMLSSARRVALGSDRATWAFGFLAGVLGGAYGMNGPPLVIYGTLRGWSPQHFRATLQGYFLPASLLVLAGYAMTGLWVPAVTRGYLLALPAVLIAIPLGRRINRRLDPQVFLRYVHAGLIVTGLVLLLQTLHAPARP
jgi:uncharacterized membrane protein YfcA